MPTFTGKTFSNFYKNILGINQSTNTGVDTTTRAIHDGAGQSTSVALSDDVLSVQPTTDNTTGTFLVKNQGGSNILAVDTSNSKVLVGASQVAANTQYAYYGIDSSENASWSANTHYIVPFIQGGVATPNNNAIGTGTDPDTSLTIATTAFSVITGYWHIIDNITIDSVTWWSAADANTGDTYRAHLMSYDVVTTAGATSGDLSNGIVAADGADITSDGHEQAYYQAMTVQSADIDVGKVVLFCFRSDSDNSDYISNVTVKYHIR